MDNNFSEQEKQTMLSVYKQLPLSIVAAEKCELITSNNRRILDLYGGHAVIPFGYSETSYIEAITKQMKKLLFQSNLLPLDIRAKAAKSLLNISPHNLAKVFFVNSGSEANENALKIACKVTKRKKILAVTHGFHGRTAASAAVSWGSNDNWYGFPDTPFEVDFIPRNDACSAKRMINDDVAAVIVEPIQGIAGAYGLSLEFLKTIRESCNASSSLMIVDEVQSGMGRSGSYFAIQDHDIEPDILTTAKSLGGGFPCAALLIDEEFSGSIDIGDLGSTFGGGPIACTAINFAINYITEKELLKNVKERELEIRRECLLGPVRKIQGKGFLLGLVCDQPALEVQKKLLKKNILTGTSADKKVLRLLPPLVLQSSHIERLREALTTV